MSSRPRTSSRTPPLILTIEQFGFRVKHSTSHVICDVINKLQNSCDDEKFTCLILLDLSKEFDTVNHKILLSKLKKYGVRGNSLKLINDYLTNRKQVVYVNNTYSDQHQQSLVCGVPQRSTLEPLLFSIYINDLPKASKFETRLFADDTTLFLSNDNLKTLNKNVNYELLNIEVWLNANKLSLNYSRTKYQLIKPKTKTTYKVQICCYNKRHWTRKMPISQKSRDNITWKLELGASYSSFREKIVSSSCYYCKNAPLP